ncbi:MAG: type I restriction-modification system subunit M [Prevotella sp.]|nr:type I restriction-modification system subunit M [Prevotella sp.]
MIEFCQKNIGYFIEYKNLFSTWLLPNSDFNVSTLSTALLAFDRLVNPDYNNVFKGIFNLLQLGLSKLNESPAVQTRILKDIIRLIKDVPTDGSQDFDVLGYIYEYLISNFAANAGKKAGEFYTPHEVAMLMSEIVAEHHKNKEHIEIYDPTSGSGSLLITIGKSVGKHIADIDCVKYYAQELKENTYNLTRMNLVMRGIKPENIDTRCADSLEEDWPVDPLSGMKPLRVDAVVSNPPYSQPWNPKDAEMDARFKDYGVAPKSKADYAFLLHELHHLDANGVMTIVLPHGVLFRGDPDDDSEGKIRYNLIEKNHIDTIIGLPPNIFFGTTIPTLIMVLKQHRTLDDVLIIDASKCFMKEGNRNKLRACDIKRISDTVRDRAELTGFSCRVSRDIIRQNGYNLNIPRYITPIGNEEQYDIYATMFGGIPNREIDLLSDYWKALPALRNDIFNIEADKPYSTVKVENVSTAVEGNADVSALRKSFSSVFDDFGDMLHDKLISHVGDVNELLAQDEIAEDIFRRFADIPLIDKYAAYQVLADKWQYIMEDIEIIQSEGVDACRKVETAYKIVKDKEGYEEEVPFGLKGRIIPFEIVQHSKFQAELNSISDKKSRLEDTVSELDEIRDGFTDEAQTAFLDEKDNTKFDKKAINAGAKIKGDEIETETKHKLKQIVAMWTEQKTLRKAIKDEEAALVDKTKSAIEALTDTEIEQYLHEKWIEPICVGIEKTLNSTLSELEKKVETLTKKYTMSVNSLDNQLVDSQSELAGLVDELSGDEWSIVGLKEFVNK